jgi:hypothetical protein
MGLGVELDREKMGLYHEKYMEVGTYPVFGVHPDQSLTVPVSHWPSY